MRDRGYSLTRGDAARVNAATQFAERFTREGVNVTPLPGLQPGNTSEPVLWPVEVTALPPGDGPAGLFVGLLWLPDPSTTPPWRSEACWVREVPGRPPAVGDAGMAKCVGWEPAVGPYDPLPVYSLLCCGGGGFHARLVSGSGAGPWVVQPVARDSGAWVDDGGTVTPAYAKPWRNASTPRPQVGDVVWVKRSEADPDEYEFVSHPNFDCGFDYSPTTDTYEVDVASLAGSGLLVSAVFAGCDRLVVNAGCGLLLQSGQLVVQAAALAGAGLVAEGDCGLAVNPGCGLTVAADAVALDLAAVVADGLYWDAPCTLGVDYGCGLTITSDQLTVDYATLAGDNALSSLVVVPTGSDPCDSLGVDLETVTTETKTVVTDVELVLDGGDLILVKEKTGFNFNYNAAGLLIDVTFGAPVETEDRIDACLFGECCEATAPTATAAGDPTTINVNEDVDFTGSASGGVAPYTYAWDFDDGGSSTTQNPNHTFTAAGEYTVTLTVTDACGRTDTDTVVVTVLAPVATGCCAEDVPGVLYAHVASGTFAGTYPMVAVGDGVTWNFLLEYGAFGSCPQGGVYAPITLKCNEADAWELYTEDLAAGPFTPASVGCDPFSVVFNGVSWISDCGTDSGITVTVDTNP